MNDPTLPPEGDPPGEPGAGRRLTPELYDELRRLARAYLRPGSARTLQPTALVHEAYVRLADREEYRSQTHFQAVAAVAMRHVLLDHVRGQGRDKRGGGWDRVTLSAVPGLDEGEGIDVEELESALQELARIDARGARIVELRFFGGLTEKDVGELLQVSERTVRNDWSMARAWLRCRLQDGNGGPTGGPDGNPRES